MEHQRDGSRTIAAAVIALGGAFYVVLGGLSAPPAVVVGGLVLYLVAVVEMVRRLRRGGEYALAIPVVFLVVWTVVLLAGMLVGAWVP